MTVRALSTLLLSLAAPLALAATAAPPPQVSGDDMSFMAFPMATDIAAADAPAFAWIMRQAPNSTVMFARAPEWKPLKLFVQPDVDGAPVTAVHLSRDGRTIVFQTATPLAGGEDSYNPAGLVDPPKATLWAVETVAGAKPVKIGIGANAAFAPDGKRVIFRRGRDLWVAEMADPTKPVLLAAGGTRYAQAAWGKDGKSIYFVQDRGGYSFLGRYEFGADRVQWIVTGADRLSQPLLSPDGRSVAYLRWPGRRHGVTIDYTESEPFAVETVDLATGTVRTLWQSQGKAGSGASDDPEGHLRWADDRNIVFRSEADGWARLYAVSRSGGTPRPLTPAKCEVAESELVAPDTLFVIHNCRDIDTRQLSRITVSSGAERAIESRDAVLGLATASGDGRHIAYTGATADAAPLIRVMDVQSGRLALAQTPADYGYTYRFAAPAPQAVRLKAADGGTVPAQLFLPAGKGPHPALVYVHGGPSRQMFPAFHFGTYYANDFAVNRRLADLGYAVLSVNYRSGVGYGRDFREAAKRGWRGASEYSDVLGAGRWLAERKDIDRKRIGIWGGSYGGLLTGQALARNSDLFAAGVAVHGVFDWSWPSPVPGHLNPSRFFGVSEADRPLALQSSPLGHVDSWTSPVLLFSGDQDMNVDVAETVDLHQRLRAKGVDVRTVILPGEAHDLVRHASWQRLWKDSRAFWQEKFGK